MCLIAADGKQKFRVLVFGDLDHRDSLSRKELRRGRSCAGLPRRAITRVAPASWCFSEMLQDHSSQAIPDLCRSRIAKEISPFMGIILQIIERSFARFRCQRH